MKIEFILVATGSAILARVSHAIFTNSIDRAKEEGAEIAGILSKAGYFQFSLYDIRSDEHVCVANYSVETPEPVVKIK